MRILIDLQGAQGVNRNHGIGRLTRALARAMITSSDRHEPVILLNDAIPESAEALSEEFAALLPQSHIRFWRGLTDAAATGDAGCIMRRRAAERIRAHAIASMQVDAVHMSSVFEGGSDDTITNWPTDLHRPPHFATFYDAIPLINREQYLRGTWKDLTPWYLRQIHEVRSLDGLLAISESSRGEAIDHLHFDPARVFNIRAGFDASVFRPVYLQGSERQDFLGRYGLREGYLLFVGAGDARKNVRGLLQAYGMLPEALRTKQQLVMVGATDPAALVEFAASLDIRPEDLVMPRYIPEEDLATLYSHCGLFVMPSKHEGFGLPALEAMACGAPVVASNTTSLPEVVGLADALFDPNSPASMSDRIRAALESAELRTRLVEHGRRQAATFTWDESARRAWEALELMATRNDRREDNTSGAVLRRKPRLAFVGDVPDTAQAAKADLDFFLELGTHYEVTLVTDKLLAEDHEIGAAFPVRSQDDFAAHAAGFERILYGIGRLDHRVIEELLPTFPGVAWIQNDKLAASMLAALQDSEDRERLARIMFNAHGWRAIDALSKQPVGEKLVLPFLPAFREALAIVQLTPDTPAAGHSLAAHCRATIEAAYAFGPAGQREACVRSIRGPDLLQIARAVIQSLPLAAPQRLLIDADVLLSDGFLPPGGLLQLVGNALRQAGGGADIVELVGFRDGVLQFARAQAAEMLDLSLHGLQDAVVSVAPTDTLVLRARSPRSGTATNLPLLRSLRRRGMRVVALLLEELAEPPTFLPIADGVICGTEELARSIGAGWNSAQGTRREPVGISWPTGERELLHVPPAGRWPLWLRPD